jgi:DNA (cytosine-5)-methyltransferase 1
VNDLTHLSLFTGIGGIDLAAEWAGFRSIGQVEQNKYALRIMRNRFGRRISRWSDIRDISASDFKRRTGIDSPTLISGGFPCQPFSCAGKRRGKEDDRYLWPEMFRVVRELRPSWVIGENVAGIVSMELEPCCTDLEGEGYTVRAFLIPACGVGAWHRRERVFIVAHTDSPRVSPGGKDRRVGRIGESVTDIPYSNSTGLSCSWTTRETTGPNGGASATTPGGNWWDAEPAVGRVAHGVPHRVDRLRCLGNAVVPQQIYPILAGITQIEETKMIEENEVRE